VTVSHPFPSIIVRPVAKAVTEGKGVTVKEYRDYRGVPAVAAWTWLPQYDLGVVTEIDTAEAYAPLYIIRPVFWGLFWLLAVPALATFLFPAIVLLQERRQRRKSAIVTRDSRVKWRAGKFHTPYTLA
jgi:hypothetical protein